MDLLCSVDVAAVRAEPRADAERVTELLRGEPVRIEETSEGWMRIRTAYETAPASFTCPTAGSAGSSRGTRTSHRKGGDGGRSSPR
jgi:Bacterial dipeptidyl-peptidase Sh3 domain